MKTIHCPNCEHHMEYVPTTDGDWCLWCSECGVSGPTAVTKLAARNNMLAWLSKLANAKGGDA